MKKAVVIVAAGSGRRMGDKMPKQFLQIDGKPILVHTLDRFRHFDPGMEIVMVLAPAQIKWWEEVTVPTFAPAMLIKDVNFSTGNQ